MRKSEPGFGWIVRIEETSLAESVTIRLTIFIVIASSAQSRLSVINRARRSKLSVDGC